MLLQDLQARLEIALSAVIEEEYSLFATGAQTMLPSERAVAAQLAFRLRHVLVDRWDVDIEYSSRITLGEARIRSRSMQLPATASLAVHRRGQLGRDNNLLLLGLMMHGGSHFEGEIQRLSGLMQAFDYQYAAILHFNPAYTSGGDPPVMLLPTWHWVAADPRNADIYARDAALALCRRGHQRYSLRRDDDRVEDISQLALFPTMAEARRVDVLQQLEARYGDWIRSDIRSVAFVQLADSLWLEIRTQPGGDRIWTNYLSGYFEPADPIEVNVADFLRWDDLSIVMCTDLLEEEAARAIAISHGQADEEDFFDF